METGEAGSKIIGLNTVQTQTIPKNFKSEDPSLHTRKVRTKFLTEKSVKKEKNLSKKQSVSCPGRGPIIIKIYNFKRFLQNENNKQITQNTALEIKVFSYCFFFKCFSP